MNAKRIAPDVIPGTLTAILLGAALIGLGLNLARAEDHSMHHNGVAQPAADPHSMHHHEHVQHAIDHSSHVLPEGVKRSLSNYDLPDVQLIGSHGKAVRLAAELDTQAPVLVNFIFTSCSAICPLTTATFAQVQDKLAASGKPFRLISISIDPEQDTPARLKEYAGKFGAGSDWHFLTGDAASVLEVQRAFKAWRGGKQNHAPITYLRAAPGTPWVRYEGLVDADTLVEDYQRYTASLKTVKR